MKKVFLILLFIFSCSNDNSENQPIGQANPELGKELFESAVESLSGQLREISRFDFQEN